MKNYLNALNERERWMILFTALCLLLYGYFMLLYAPLNNSIAQKKSQLIEKTETLAWMQKVKQQGYSGKKTQLILDNSQLLSILATQLKDNPTFQLSYQLQQTGSGDIQLTFDAVPFQLFMNWLSKISEKYRITIKQFDVLRNETPGVTKLMIVISTSS